MASITNVISNYKSLNTDLSGRQQIKTPAGSLALIMKDLHLIYVPTGSVFPYAGSSAPETFLFCDGSAVSRFTYFALFEIIGTTYGAGDGSTTFNLPNLKGKVPVCRDAAQTEFDVLGETGGSKTHTLTVPEMPIHSHTITDPQHRHDIIDKQHSHGGTANQASTAINGASNNTGNGGSTSLAFTGIENTELASTGITGTNNTGGNQPHNNLQPYIVLNYIIKI